MCVPLLAIALAGTGCSPAPAPEAAPDHERRQRLREQLRSRLGDRYDAPIPQGSTASLEQGARLYDLLCRACHGPTGRGNGRSARSLPEQPPDLADPREAAFFSDQAKLAIIAEGVAGTPMIGWSAILAEEERIAVLQFMQTLVREPSAP
jgi:high-affinity iron transporter